MSSGIDSGIGSTEAPPRSSLGLSLFHLKEWIKTYLQRIPWLYQLVMHWKSRRTPSLLVRKNQTRIVIEAYPRSSNSFGYRLFWHANPEIQYEEIAHHSHIISNVKHAAKWNIPALIIIRNPVDAISSYMIASNDLSDGMLKILTRRYLDFYEWVEGNRDKVVVVSFEDMTAGRFRAVSERLNEKFGESFNTDFDETELAESARNTILEVSPNRERPGKIPIPDKFRENIYGDLKPRVSASPVVQPAIDLYDRLIASIAPR